MMSILHLLAVVGLVVVVAATDPHDFSRLCSSPAPGGECPAGWRNVGGDCLKFMSGWDQAKAKEVCREERAEYKEYVMMTEYSDSAAQHLLPVCLVRRETQCQCGRTYKKAETVGGVQTEKTEYPWQGKSLYEAVLHTLYLNFNVQFACQYPVVRVGAPSSAETRSSPPLIALRVSNISVPLKFIVNGVGHSVESINVTTRADDEVPGMVDDEVNHSVCSKREKSDEEFAILTLCKPLMFSKG